MLRPPCSSPPCSPRPPLASRSTRSTASTSHFDPGGHRARRPSARSCTIPAAASAASPAWPSPRCSSTASSAQEARAQGGQLHGHRASWSDIKTGVRRRLRPHRAAQGQGRAGAGGRGRRAHRAAGLRAAQPGRGRARRAGRARRLLGSRDLRHQEGQGEGGGQGRPWSTAGRRTRSSSRCRPSWPTACTSWRSRTRSARPRSRRAVETAPYCLEMDGSAFDVGGPDRLVVQGRQEEVRGGHRPVRPVGLHRADPPAR